jgi:hypothetical protein
MDRKQLRQWLNEHLSELYPEPVEASVSDRELLLLGRLTAESDLSEDDARTRIQEHREESRSRRMALAQELHELTGLAVAWGVRLGNVTAYFSSHSVPVMSRLGRAERDVLDTLIRGGVARNRSHALNWAVQSFARGRRDWLRQLREATDSLRDIREGGLSSETFDPEPPPETGTA